MLDHAEDNLFQIEREMVAERHFTRVEAVLADCQETERIFEVMQRFKPNIVFHAAAYKHVPLMESNPLEAVRNNSFATRITADCAAAAGAERFVLISTDKAVNPQTVMGASKAMAEWAVAAADAHHANTRFVSVRFGNVLGSSGSVVPIFKRQIEQGGPVTVTHPEMTRFFMTIPEAVQLVIRAGDTGVSRVTSSCSTWASRSRSPTAENMIKLAGREPEKDIAIEFTGPRPGRSSTRAVRGGRAAAADGFETDHEGAVREEPIDPEWIVQTLDRLSIRSFRPGTKRTSPRPWSNWPATPAAIRQRSSETGSRRIHPPNPNNMPRSAYPGRGPPAPGTTPLTSRKVEIS